MRFLVEFHRNGKLTKGVNSEVNKIVTRKGGGGVEL